MVYMYLILFLFNYTIQINTLPLDDIDRGLRDGAMIKMMRAIKNQTQEDTLNLSANATSIRENITDNFSCENRTYGYYADIDNECQVFHVCLPSQTPSGRNTTYRWSFICPKETLFNQEILTCMRPRDSINCEDSEIYYDVNMEMGKLPNDTQSSEPNYNAAEHSNYNTHNLLKKDVERIRVNQRRPEKRKQNIKAHKAFEEIKQDMIEMEVDIKEIDAVVGNKEDKNAPELISVTVEETSEFELDDEDDKDSFKTESTKIVSEMSLKKREKRSGGFRFMADV